MQVVGVKSVKIKKPQITFLPQEKPMRSIIFLTVMVNMWFAYLIAKHVVKNIQVKLPTILEEGGTILNLKLKRLWLVPWKISRKSSYRVTFYNQNTKAFLKTWKLGWLIKNRILTQSIKNFAGWEHLKLFILNVWISRVTIVTFFFSKALWTLFSCISVSLGA